MRIFLRHPYDEVVATLGNLHVRLKLRIRQRVQFDILVVRINRPDNIGVNFELKNQKKTAANFCDVLWSAAGEYYQFVLENEGTLNMKVDNIEVELG